MAEERRTFRSFSSIADVYGEYRPGYPQGVYDLIAQACQPESDTVVLDVGCGTGNVARELKRLYPNVYGIEPSPEMLEQAQRFEDRVLWIRSFAEHLPVLSDSVDLITAAQAIHWFDEKRFMAEAMRTLKAGAHIAAFWEGAAKGEPYRTEIHAIVNRRRGIEPDTPNPIYNKLIEVPPKDDWTSVWRRYGFRDTSRHFVEYDLQWTIERFVGYINSWSNMTQFSESDRLDLDGRFREALLGIAGGDEFVERNVTALYIGRL